MGVGFGTGLEVGFGFGVGIAVDLGVDADVGVGFGVSDGNSISLLAVTIAGFFSDSSSSLDCFDSSAGLGSLAGNNGSFADSSVRISVAAV